MSLQRKVSMPCPNCSALMEATVWDSINVTLMPELREQLLTEDIFFNQCPHCRQMVYIPWNTLYHDMEHRFMLFYCHSATDIKLLHLPRPIMNFQQGYCIRAVHGVMNLKEKILILESKMNDVAVEYLKFLLMNHLVQVPHWHWDGVERLSFGNADANRIQIIRFNPDNQLAGELILAHNVYAEALAVVEQNAHLQAKPGANIGRGWIERQMQIRNCHSDHLSEA